MSYFPSHLDERAETETALDVALPHRYVALLRDERIQKILSHPKIGALDPANRVGDFVAATIHVRQSEPGFPSDGVLCMLPAKQRNLYLRYWLPERKCPRQLGETIFVWDIKRKKQLTDCINDEFIQGLVALVHGVDPSFLASIGYPIPLPTPKPALIIKNKFENLQQRLAPNLTVNVAEVDFETWLAVGEFQLRGNWLAAYDLATAPSPHDRFGVKTAPGIYQIAVRLAPSSRGDWSIIGTVRVLHGASEGLTRQYAYRLDVDQAAVATYDRQAFFRQVPPEDRDWFIEDLLENEARAFIALAGKSAEVMVVPAGNGDGTYDVFALQREGTTVGMEIVFARSKASST